MSAARHQHQRPPCSGSRGTGTFGNHQPALSIVHGPDTTTLDLDTTAHGHGAFSTSAKTPRWRVGRCCEELCSGINYPLRRSVLFTFQTCNHHSDTGWTRNYHLPCINPAILTFYPWKVREWDYRNLCKTFYRWTFAPVKVTNGFIPAVRVCPVLCSVLFMIMTLHIPILYSSPAPVTSTCFPKLGMIIINDIC